MTRPPIDTEADALRCLLRDYGVEGTAARLMDALCDLRDDLDVEGDDGSQVALLAVLSNRATKPQCERAAEACRRLAVYPPRGG